MAVLEISKDVFVYLDEEDVDVVLGKKWRVSTVGSTSYAVTRKQVRGEKKNTLMHRLIMQPLEGEVVDHIDGNGLNNRRSNLRICRQFQNCWNRRDAKTIGVSFKTQNNKWIALISYRGKRLGCGLYDDKDEAQKARNFAAYVLWGGFSNITPEDFSGFDPARLPIRTQQFMASKMHDIFKSGGAHGSA